MSKYLVCKEEEIKCNNTKMINFDCATNKKA